MKKQENEQTIRSDQLNMHVNKRVNCVHHWQIESPNGPKSEGVCKHCGAKKFFSNVLEYKTWNTRKATK